MLQQPKPDASFGKKAKADGVTVRWSLVRRLRAGPDGDLLLAEPDCWKNGAASLDGAHFGPRALAAYSSLLALRLSGLLLALERGEERKVVWHLGPSSGALARGLRLLLPNCSQIVSGQADMLAAMAGTLRRALPGCRVLTARTSDEVGEDALSTFDFVFLPDEALDAVRPPRLDLIVSLLALQRIEREAARACLRHAHDLGCLFLYSLSQPSRPGGDVASAGRLISEYYWPHRIPVKHDLGALRLERAVQLPPIRDEPEPDGSRAPEHIVGWRKILP